MSTNPISTDPITSTSTGTGTARSRLTADQEASLRNQAASWQMESMTLGEEHLEVLAAYGLG